MLQIHQALQRGNYPNATRLARELEVSTKSIYRDLDFMRDRFQLPIEFDVSRNGFYYSSEVGSFPSLQISEGELFALLVAEKALQQYAGTPFEAPLTSAFQKMTSSLPDTISVHLSDWEQSISFRTSAEPVVRLDIFRDLSRAVASRQRLKLQYRKPGQKGAEERLVDPYHLANVNGEWFLFAYCHMRHDVRTFVPSRIGEIEVTGETFPRPNRFSLQKQLRDSFGVHSREGKFCVRVRFEERVADYIREKRWHPSQILRELSDGAVELELQLSSLVEVHRWLLGWGAAATVLAPQQLVEMIRNSAQGILANYPVSSQGSPAKEVAENSR
jgi:proteasome accessory factor B